MKLRSIVSTLGLGLLLIVLSACGSKTSSLLSAQDSYRLGDLENADLLITEYAESQQKKEGPTTILAFMQKGHIAQTKGDIEASVAAYAAADHLIDEADAAAETSISEETGATLSNMDEITYVGQASDRIMLNTYQALNYLRLGDHEKARVEFQRAYFRQTDAVRLHQEAIEKARKETEEAKQGDSSYDADKAQEDDAFKEQLKEKYGDLEQFKLYAPYVNPYSEFLQALYYSHLGVDGADWERGRVSMERVVAMSDNNTFLKQDLELIEKRLKGEKIKPVTYIIFESGTGPIREEVSIQIPTFGIGGAMTATANFPKLAVNEDYLPSLAIAAGETKVDTEAFADIDAVVGHEFEIKLPLIITKTLIAVGVKTAVSEVANQAASQGDAMLGMVMNLATKVYRQQTGKADLRTWSTLPKQVGYARVSTPDDGKLTLSAGALAPVEVNVNTGKSNLVIVRGISQTTPLSYSVIKLGD